MVGGVSKTEWARAQLAIFQHFGMAQRHRVPGRSLHLDLKSADQVLTEIDDRLSRSGLGDGDESPDWTVPLIDQENGEITLQLRAERSGSGDGRVYSIHITATDESGMSSNAIVEIIVPHDKAKK